MQQQLPNKHNNWCKDIFFLTLIFGGLFFILLGTSPLFVPDEGRYAEIAREMLISHDYVTPYLNGIKYFEKPAMFYWFESAAAQIGGLNLWSLRSVNAILGTLCCLLTYFTVRKLYNRTTGLLASLILGTSTLYFVMAHMISLDLPVTVFLTITLYLFLLGIHCPPGNSRRFYLWGASATAACAVLTKGLIGLIFPTMIIAAWIILMDEWRLLASLYLPSCTCIFLLIAAPWHILVSQRNPEFFNFYFVQQHFLRYTTLEIGHYQPVWFFIPNLIIGFFPWIVFLPLTIKNIFSISWKKRSENKIEIFLFLWAAFIFIFFSFSKSKLIPYILPVFPPLAILTARYLQQAITHKKIFGIKISYFFMLIFSVAIAYLFFTFSSHANIPHPSTANFYLSLSASFLLIGTLSAYLYVSKKPYHAVIITIFTSWFFLLSFYAAIPSIDARSIQPLAAILQPILKPSDEMITYNQYYQDLPFYLQRQVSILNWKNELAFGMQHQDTKTWMIQDDTFWQRFHSQKRVFTIMSQDEYKKFQLSHQKHFIIGQTLNNILISNQPNK